MLMRVVPAKQSEFAKRAYTISNNYDGIAALPYKLKLIVLGIYTQP